MSRTSDGEFPPPAASTTPESWATDADFEITGHGHRFVSRPAEARSLVDDLVPSDADPIVLSASLCPDCLAERADDRLTVPMAVFEAAGEIRLRKRCDEHGVQEDVCWTDAAMYRRARALDEVSRHPAFGTALNGETDFEDGTGSDDGTVAAGDGCSAGDAAECRAAATAGASGIGNVTITNRCDRSCHYCFFYAESGDPLYEPTKAEIRAMAARLAEEGTGAIQLTGGEPTVREDLVEIVEIAAEYADQVLLNTHGGRFAADPDLARRVSAAGARGIYTSFDGVTPRHNPKNYWEFPSALRACRDAGMCAMLVPTVVGGWNDAGLGDVVRFGAANAETVCGVNFQPVSLVGRMDGDERRARRVTIPDVVTQIAADTDGAVPAEAWFPLPVYRAISEFLANWTGTGLYGLSSTFASWMVTYVLVDDDDLVPITDVVDIGALIDALREIVEAYGADPSGLDRVRVARELLGNADDLLGPEASATAGLGGALREAIAEGRPDGLFDRLAERYDRVLPVGIRHFQDPYNYDLDRVADCDVHYAMPNGRVVPFSVYNVLPKQYRDRAKREHAISVEEWHEREYTTVERADEPNRARRDADVVDPDSGAGDGSDGEGIYGADITYRRDIDDRRRETIEEAYRTSIEDLEPV
jgi:uncharacterized radical SAM superfamily Fe-S cluster-containing enzyme